ncbi:MAG TPA: hypothetical protein VN641_07135 [Urbifossiella sp.]|nr:hypothetical protein [Urbifossiella sp.]
MPRDIRCPLCRAVFSPANEDADRVRCPECREVIDLDERESRESRRPSREPARSRRDDDDDDFEDDKPRPRPRRSSNRPRRGQSTAGGLKALYIGGGVIAGLLVLGGLVFGIVKLAGGKREFKTFSPPGGQCSILLPGTPTEQNQMIMGMQLRVFAVENRRGGYGIAYLQLPPMNMFDLNGAIQGFAGAYNGTVIHKELHPNYAEFEVETQKPKGFAAGRIVVHRGRLYQYFALGRDARLSNPDVRTFIDSFKVEDGPLPWEQQPAKAAQPPARPPAPSNPKVTQPGFQQPKKQPSPLPQLPPFANNVPMPVQPAREDTIGTSFDPKEQDDAPPGGLLVGFEVGYGKFGNNLTIGTLQPIYRSGDRESTGEKYGKDSPAGNAKLVAKPGYAIGAITAKAGLSIDGFSVTFMKIDGGRLNPNDAYESEWMGGMGGSGPQKITGQGEPATGILVRHKAQISGIGLVFGNKK